VSVRVVLATRNAGKIREIRRLLSDLDVELLDSRDFPPFPEPAEDGETYLENALAKAKAVHAATGISALADDSGICVPALGGAPGVRSARYAGDGARGLTREQIDAANNARLVADLQGLPDWSAYYYCALVLVRAPQDPQPLIADGLWYGRVIATPRGAGGFGYDPHLLLPERGLTVAELDPRQKNLISHRGQALQALLARLTQARLAA